MRQACPLVSIITPSYNQGEFLEETILSVLKQDYPAIEYIIIDGGSKDNSLEIIQKYAGELTHWVSEPDKGQTHAILKGLNYAKGEFFTWLCADDLLEPSMVSISVAFMEENKRIGISFGDRIRIDKKGNILGLSNFSHRKKFLKWGLTLPQETVLIRKSMYDLTEGLDENLQMAMDFDLWCKMIRISEFKHIPAVLGRFRSHASNKSSIFSNELKKNGYKAQLTGEFAEVYARHFGRNTSYKSMLFGKKIRKFLYYVDKRKPEYAKDIERINTIRQK